MPAARSAKTSNIDIPVQLAYPYASTLKGSKIRGVCPALKKIGSVVLLPGWFLPRIVHILWFISNTKSSTRLEAGISLISCRTVSANKGRQFVRDSLAQAKVRTYSSNIGLGNESVHGCCTLVARAKCTVLLTIPSERPSGSWEYMESALANAPSWFSWARRHA